MISFLFPFVIDSLSSFLISSLGILNIQILHLKWTWTRYKSSYTCCFLKTFLAKITSLTLKAVAIFHKQNKFTFSTDSTFSLQQISSASSKFLQTSCRHKIFWCFHSCTYFAVFIEWVYELFSNGGCFAFIFIIFMSMLSICFHSAFS